MKSIIWCSDERVIPGYGVTSNGSTVILPDNVADSFIKQGLATEDSMPDKSIKKAKKEVET